MTRRGEEQIGVAVVVEIHEEGSRGVGCDLDAGDGSHLGEGAVALIEIEEIGAIAGGEEIEQSICVDIGHSHTMGDETGVARCAERRGGLVDAGRQRHLAEQVDAGDTNGQLGQLEAVDAPSFGNADGVHVGLGLYPGALVGGVPADDGHGDDGIGPWTGQPLEVGRFHLETDILDAGEGGEEGLPAVEIVPPVQQAGGQRRVEDVNPLGLRYDAVRGLGPGRGLQTVAEVCGDGGHVPISHREGQLVELVGQCL